MDEEFDDIEWEWPPRDADGRPNFGQLALRLFDRASDLRRRAIAVEEAAAREADSRIQRMTVGQDMSGHHDAYGRELDRANDLLLTADGIEHIASERAISFNVVADSGDEPTWASFVRTSVDLGPVTLTVRQFTPSEADPMAHKVRVLLALHAGLRPSETDALLKRVEHLGPQRIASELTLEEAITVKAELERLGLVIQLTERPVRPASNRVSIPEAVRHEVWRRDEGECVDCGSRERLEFDHIIPLSKGGRTPLETSSFAASHAIAQRQPASSFGSLEREVSNHAPHLSSHHVEDVEGRPLSRTPGRCTADRPAPTLRRRDDRR